MQQPAQAQPSPGSSSFAGLLALITASRNMDHDAPVQSGFDRGDDIATISYESALRAHARYRPENRDEWEKLPSPSDPANNARKESATTSADGHAAALRTNCASQTLVDGDLRRASVTIRLSEAELHRLRQRAGEAGMTISAYLRSCTFEVETLRAQVKEVLTRLRTPGNEEIGNQGKKLKCDTEAGEPKKERDQEGRRGTVEGRSRRVLGPIIRLLKNKTGN